MDETKPPGIQIGQIYLSKAQFEHAPSSLTVPSNTSVPNIKTVISASIGLDKEGKKGFVRLVVASAPDADSFYQFHVEMVAVVQEGLEPNMDLRDYLARSGPATLYPFVREVVASLSSKGRFGPVWIPPMNFVAIGEQLKSAPAQERGGDELP